MSCHMCPPPKKKNHIIYPGHNYYPSLDQIGWDVHVPLPSVELENWLKTLLPSSFISLSVTKLKIDLSGRQSWEISSNSFQDFTSQESEMRHITFVRQKNAGKYFIMCIRTLLGVRKQHCTRGVKQLLVVGNVNNKYQLYVWGHFGPCTALTALWPSMCSN